MIEREDPHETERYGRTPYMVGLVVGAVIMYLMFHLAAGFV